MALPTITTTTSALYGWLLPISLAVATEYLSLTSHRLRYIAKFAFLYLAIQCLAIGVIVVSIVRPRNPDNGGLAARIFRKISKLVIIIIIFLYFIFPALFSVSHRYRCPFGWREWPISGSSPAPWSS